MQYRIFQMIYSMDFISNFEKVTFYQLYSLEVYYSASAFLDATQWLRITQPFSQLSPEAEKSSTEISS